MNELRQDGHAVEGPVMAFKEENNMVRYVCYVGQSEWLGRQCT